MKLNMLMVAMLLLASNSYGQTQMLTARGPASFPTGNYDLQNDALRVRINTDEELDKFTYPTELAITKAHETLLDMGVHIHKGFFMMWRLTADNLPAEERAAQKYAMLDMLDVVTRGINVLSYAACPPGSVVRVHKYSYARELYRLKETLEIFLAEIEKYE